MVLSATLATGRPLRIALVGNVQAIHLTRWGEALAARGHEVHVLTPVPGGPVAGATVHCYGDLRAARGAGRAIQALRSAGAFRRLVRKLRPDIVHVHYLNEAAAFAVRWARAPCILTAWGSDILVGARQSRLRRAALRWTLRRAAWATSDARHMMDELEALGVPRHRQALTLFGTDCEAFCPGRREEAWRQRHLRGGTLLVVSTRKLHPIYDVGTLVQAVPEILRRVPGARFVLGGDGPDRAAIERQVAESGVAGAVELLGAIAPADMPRVLASCDVYVSTSTSDGGLAASTAEAMASGLPSVVTSGGDNADWVLPGAGTLVPPRDPAALADALCALLADPTRRAAAGNTARAIITSRLSTSVAMQQVEGLYAACIPRAAAEAR